ncbi:MAG: TetR/AcrR family transcriptional regulator, partial [Cyclobacteriaceae bacterium]
ENKHKLLIYLIDWYWTWLEYRIDYEINNIKSPTERLKLCLHKLCEEKDFDPQVAHVDERALDRIMIAEFEKTFLTKQVDEDNKDGLFLPYKSLCKKIVSLITAVSPKYKFPHSLASTILVMIRHQLYYARHLPTLSDIKYDPMQQYKKLYVLIEQLVFKTIQ